MTNLEIEQADEERRGPEDIEAQIINLFVQLSVQAQEALLDRLGEEYLFHNEDDEDDEEPIFFGPTPEAPK